MSIKKKNIHLDMKSGQFKYDPKEQQQINFEINTFININHFKINK